MAQTAKVLDFKKALNANVTSEKKSKAKKKTMPVLDNAPTEVKDAVDHYVKHKKLMNEHKADMEAAGVTIIDFGEEHQDKEGFNGNFRKSYKVQGKKEVVSFVSSNRYSLDSSDEETLRTLVDGKFEELFEEVFEVELRPEVLQDEKLQAEFMELVGEQFGKFFVTRKTLKVADEFDKNVYKLNKKKVANLRAYVKQYKPSLR